MVTINLENKVALVTGASRGIGREIALVLSKAGATVAVGYGTSAGAAEETRRACGSRAFAVQGDVGDAQECKRIVRTIIDLKGRIDILVNNAGIFEQDSFAMPFEAWMNHWRRTIDTNFMSAVHLSYLTIQTMRQQGGGKIINVASRAAFRGETEYFAYAASKAAMVNFTRCLGRTFARENIVSFAVAPGFIRTDMVKDELERYGEEILSQVPSGEIGTPIDVANVVLFLASDLAHYMTGTTIDVNGGSYLH